MKKLFHELPIGARRALFNGKGMAWGQFKKQYKQPAWCGYPDALDPLGCWSLIDPECQISREYCRGCDCYKFTCGKCSAMCVEEAE